MDRTTNDHSHNTIYRILCGFACGGWKTLKKEKNHENIITDDKRKKCM
jgi:hypothetical protein